MIPSEQPLPWAKELSQLILYRAVGAVLGCLFVVGSYMLSQSLGTTLIFFAAVAIPLWFGGDFYVYYRIRYAKKDGRLPIRAIVYRSIAHAFCIFAVPAMFLIYVYLRL
jgi:ABC-type uncharacterized transport system permease subunit